MAETKTLEALGEADFEAEFKKTHKLHVSIVARMFKERLPTRKAWDLAEDVVAEAWLIAWAKRSEWRGDASLSSWVIAICKLLVWNARRRRQLLSLSDVDKASALVDPIAHRLSEQLMAALSPKAERIMRLTYWDGLVAKEIASLDGETVRTIALRRQRIQNKLKKLFR